MVQLINDSKSVIITTQFLPDVLIVPGVWLKETENNRRRQCCLPLFSVITGYTFFFSWKTKTNVFHMYGAASTIFFGLVTFVYRPVWILKHGHPGSLNKTSPI